MATTLVGVAILALFGVWVWYVKHQEQGLARKVMDGAPLGQPQRATVAVTSDRLDETGKAAGGCNRHELNQKGVVTWTIESD